LAVVFALPPLLPSCAIQRRVPYTFDERFEQQSFINIRELYRGPGTGQLVVLKLVMGRPADVLYLLNWEHKPPTVA
jgi:hypothetical protein